MGIRLRVRHKYSLLLIAIEDAVKLPNTRLAFLKGGHQMDQTKYCW